MEADGKGRSERPIQLTSEEAAAFWEKLAGGGIGCWEWPGRRNHDGYGIHYYARTSRMAHRIAYTLSFGPIVSGHFICHKCDNPACCRPDHLFAGTHSDNMKDMAAKKRGSWITRPDLVPRGERNVNAKLDRRAVFEILRLRRAGTRVTDLAKQFGISVRTIHRITHGKAWQHLMD